MTLTADCIFCKIIRGEIPSFRVYEDEQALGFMDINPINAGHALVIPKFHAENIFVTPDEWMAAAAVATRKVARAVQATLNPYGVNIVQANGPGAKQSVFHMHIHIVPRVKGDGLLMNWPIQPGNMDEIRALAEKIKANLPTD